MSGSSVSLLFLELRLPGRPLTIAGVILHDALDQSVVIKMREHWEGVAEPEDQEVLSEYECGLRQLANELGADAFIDHLSSSFANTVTVSPEYRVNRPEGDKEHYATMLLEKLRFDL